MALYDRISKVSINRESIQLNVRVIRMWNVPMFNNPSQINSLELILIDEEGSKIQATVRKPLLHKFSSILEEGSVYKMVYFNVVPNTGHYRATFHEFKLVFLYKSTVIKKESDSLPMYGFSFVPFNEVLTYDDNYENLIDVVGVLTRVYPERQYMKDGKITSMVTMELTDPNGQLDCTLFGEYVEQLRNLLNGGGNVQVVVIMQLARVKTFRGKTVIQHSMNATKLLLNPDVPDAIEFRNSIAEHGFIDVEPFAVVLDNSKEGLQNEFLKLHPKKTIAQLESIKEDGLCVVMANIVEVIAEGDWYYFACKCNRSVTLQSGVHFCEACKIPVLHVSPRFKVKVEVAHAADSAVFVLFDRDISLLIHKTCEDLFLESAGVVSDKGYPALLDTLIGKKMLFKLETKGLVAKQFEGTFPVRKVCYDEDIMQMFDLIGSNMTPTKAVFPAPFPKISTDIIDLEEPFSQDNSQHIVATIPLGDDDNCCLTKFTPAKRKLENDFHSCQEGSSSSGVKVDANVEGVDDVKQYSGLLEVKIEKD